MLVVLGAIEVHPDDVGAAVELASKMAAATMTEPGCIQYAFGADITQPNRFFLTERWESPEALMSHFTTPHMAAFQQAMQKIRVQHLSATRYDVAGVTNLIGG